MRNLSERGWVGICAGGGVVCRRGGGGRGGVWGLIIAGVWWQPAWDIQIILTHCGLIIHKHKHIVIRGGREQRNCETEIDKNEGRDLIRWLFSINQSIPSPSPESIDKLYTQIGKVFCLHWELNLVLPCFGLSVLHSRIYWNSWPSLPA